MRQTARGCMLVFGTVLSVLLQTTQAGPEGAQVVHGDVSFSQSGNTTSITASDRSIINYSSFDIARPEIVQFIQPHAQASVLNRINSARPTNIEGTLRANGGVIFVNPAGVYIREGAQINANRFVASALNISDADFLSGRMNFAGGEGSVINRGDIVAEKAYLVGREVVNSGNISCSAGHVVMAAGERVFLRENGSDILVEVEPPTQPQTPELQEPQTAVSNEGTVTASGGSITFAAGDIYSHLISNTGSLTVSAQTGSGGQIKVAGGRHFSNAGTIEATSDDASGGTVTVNSANVINSGTIDVTGSQGGNVTMEATGRLGQFGAVRADGTAADGGKVDLSAGDVVALGTESLTTASAGSGGNGGDVTVYSPDTALFWADARIEATGGAESGDGGFVEVSGSKHVEVIGDVDASAGHGESGKLLLDPIDVTIQDSVGTMDPGENGAFTPSVEASTVSDDAIEEWLNGGTSVEIIAAGVDTIHGNITQEENARIDKTAGGDATIRLVGQSIALDGGIVSESGKLAVRLDADQDVTIGADIETNGGRFKSTGVGFDNTEGSITTAGGTVRLEHSGEMRIGRVDAQGGTAKIAAAAIHSGDDPEEDIAGDSVKVAAISGAIGPLEVSAPRRLHATTLEDGSDIVISSSTTLDNVSAWAGGNVKIAATDLGDTGKTTIQANLGDVDLEGEESLTLNSVVALGGSIDVESVRGITVANRAEAQTSIELHSGTDGGGNLSFEPGAVLASESIVLRAGDGLDLGKEALYVLKGFTCRDTDFGEAEWLGGGGKEAAVKFEGMEIAPGNVSFTIWQDASIDQTPGHGHFEPGETRKVNLVLQSDDGFIASATAHDWKSIAANARDDITLVGPGDITTEALSTRNGNITVHSTGGDVIANGEIDAHWSGGPECLGCPVPNVVCTTGGFDRGPLYEEVAAFLHEEGVRGGGVQLLSDKGYVFTHEDDAPNQRTLNVHITGTWDANPNGVGVPLPGDKGLAAIVISSQENLHLGPSATLELRDETKAADGAIVDDRHAIGFLAGSTSYEGVGDSIDVSIYLRSTRGNVTVESEAEMGRNGTLVMDAWDKVEDFGENFIREWAQGQVAGLEVVSRTSATLSQAARHESLPGATELRHGEIPAWINDAANGNIVKGDTTKELPAQYVLRGGEPGLFLASTEVSVQNVHQERWAPATQAAPWVAVLALFLDPIPEESVQEDKDEQNKREPSEDKDQSEGMYVEVEDSEGNPIVPKVGLALAPGYVVRTKQDGVASIEFCNDSIVVLEPDSAVTIENPSVLLMRGVIFNWLDKKYRGARAWARGRRHKTAGEDFKVRSKSESVSKPVEYEKSMAYLDKQNNATIIKETDVMGGRDEIHARAEGAVRLDDTQTKEAIAWLSYSGSAKREGRPVKTLEATGEGKREPVFYAGPDTLAAAAVYRKE